MYLPSRLLIKILRRLSSALFVVARGLWYALPLQIQHASSMRPIANTIFRFARKTQTRAPNALYTRFLRNRPQLDVLTNLLLSKGKSELSVASLGCSCGAEINSLIYLVKRQKSDVNLHATGIDNSQSAIERAVRGYFSLNDPELQGLTTNEVDELFDRHGEILNVKSAFRSTIRYYCQDAFDKSAVFGAESQDLVIVNNVFVHMQDNEVPRSFARALGYVRPGGYICVWGIDLELREHIVTEHQLISISDNDKAIYIADERSREVWPWKYEGLEPFNERHPKRALRYATIFKKC